MRSALNVVEKKKKKRKCAIKETIDEETYNRSQKLLRQTRKTASYLKPQAIENSFKRAYGEVEDNIIIYI